MLKKILFKIEELYKSNIVYRLTSTNNNLILVYIKLYFSGGKMQN